MKAKIITEKITRIIAAGMGISSIVLGCVWYGWKLSLVIFLALTANNLANSLKK